MKIAVFGTKPYDRRSLAAANTGPRHDLLFLEPRLTAETAPLAVGCGGVCAFINDELGKATLQILAAGGTRLIALRSAGFNHVDLKTAGALGMKVVRVPSYSPYAVAEHALALMMTLNRKTHRAYNRVRESDFSLEGLIGFDMNGRTAGIIGTGKIGVILAQILSGMGCRVLGFDPYPHEHFAKFGSYVDLAEILRESHIISLHCPLTPESHHLINKTTLAQMRPGVMLINTSRGALIDSQDVTDALKSGHVGYLGLDVYEQEADLFYENLSGTIIQDDVFQRLLTFPNVLITAHQAFFTENALKNIADTTLGNITDFENGNPCANEVTSRQIYHAA
ncbi:MAG: 2-hydroxyacid dehydrogenase [Chthoniobacteraceae bacterium]